MILGLQLPALQVVLPLLAAPLCSILRLRHAAWALATLTSWGIFAVSIAIMQTVITDGVISYAMGNWDPPWGIEIRIDILNAYMLILVTAINAIAITFARLSVADEIGEEQHPLFYTAWMLCITGLLGITVTGDAFNVFVFLEISSLATYVLVSCGRDRRALVASYKYLVMGTIGATFFLVGVGLIYIMTGTLNMQDIASRLPDHAGTAPVLAAAGFITLGLALKFAMFPLHMWLPNAYAFSPSVISALLAATSTKISIYVLLRFEFLIFQPGLRFHGIDFAHFLMPFSVMAFVIGSIAAIYQTNIKRLLAYSSVAQVGYMLLGISLMSVMGLTGAIVHFFNHAIIKSGLFLVVGCLVYRYGTSHIRSLDGCAREMPWTMGAFVIGGLSLIGVPLTAGFVSKVYLISAALEKGTLGYALTGLVVFSSLLAVIYIWRIVEAAYLRPRPADAPAVREAPLSLLIPTWILALASLYFGIDTSFSAGFATEAATQLLTGKLP